MKNFLRFFLKLNWRIFVCSSVITLIVVSFVPLNITDRIPFTNHDFKETLVCIVIFSVIYLILDQLTQMIKWQNIDRCSREEDKRNIKENIEKLRKKMDELPDFEYSVVMFLLKNGNKEPYVSYNNYYKKDTILNDDIYFNKSPIMRKVQQKEHSEMIGYSLGYRYLLTDKMYNNLIFIFKEFGQISHFERDTIDLNQGYNAL